MKNRIKNLKHLVCDLLLCFGVLFGPYGLAMLIDKALPTVTPGPAQYDDYCERYAAVVGC